MKAVFWQSVQAWTLLVPPEPPVLTEPAKPPLPPVLTEPPKPPEPPVPPVPTEPPKPPVLVVGQVW